MTENSFNPAQLPMLEGLGSRIHSPYASSPDQRQGLINGPACVRDLIHSAIVKNLDKDKNVIPAQMPEDFRRRLASTASNLGNGTKIKWYECLRGGDIYTLFFVGRRNDVDVASLARNIEENPSRPPSNLLHPRSATSQNPTPKSPNRSDLALPTSASPSRRDLSPHMEDKRHLRSPAAPTSSSVSPANYQFSTRQNLLADFQTSRQIHAEQSGGHPPQENGQPGLCQKF